MNLLPRNVGLEIEFSATPAADLSVILTTLRDCLRRHEYPVSDSLDYRKSRGSTFDIKRDASCGGELATPIITTYEHLLRSAEAVDHIRELGGVVNASCGLHVHVDATGMTNAQIECLYRFVTRYERAFFCLAPQHRHTNRYCRSLKDVAPEIRKDLRKGITTADRHRWVNGVALTVHSTVEFRLMASTLDPATIVGWTMFLAHLVEYIARGKKVQWGEAKAKTPRDLLQTMLGQAGFYGPFEGRSKEGAIIGRQWAVSTFTALSGTEDRRVKPLDFNLLKAMVPND